MANRIDDTRRPGVELLDARRFFFFKHCTEDLREQADRSAISSTLAVVQAPCNMVTPVAPGLQLSSEANAIVAAIPWHLDLMGSRSRWRCWRDKMTTLKTDVVQLSAQVQHHDQKMSEFGRQLIDVTA